jgi:hypothetical protein
LLALRNLESFEEARLGLGLGADVFRLVLTCSGLVRDLSETEALAFLSADTAPHKISRRRDFRYYRTDIAWKSLFEWKVFTTLKPSALSRLPGFCLNRLNDFLLAGSSTL